MYNYKLHFNLTEHMFDNNQTILSC